MNKNVQQSGQRYLKNSYELQLIWAIDFIRTQELNLIIRKNVIKLFENFDSNVLN